MVTQTFLWIARRSPRGRRLLFRLVFNRMAHVFGGLDWWTFMNYGYADLDGGADGIALEATDEAERYPLQLYDRVARGADIAGKEVLEVSCGRGGGASYISRYLKPKTLAAIDISAHAIAFCRRVHGAPGLRFLEGDAERLPFPANSFDVVVNVEASFAYADIDRFFAEVVRVLRPGGRFLYADLRLADEVDGLVAALAASDLELLAAEEITENVVKALEIDNGRRVEAVARSAPVLLRRVMRTFVGAEGTRFPTLLGAGDLRYFNFVLEKPAAPDRGAATRSSLAAPPSGTPNGRGEARLH